MGNWDKTGGRERTDLEPASEDEGPSAEEQLAQLRFNVARHRRGIQRKAERAASAQAKIPEGGGAQLSPDVRARMEGHLGADFSAVKVHTGGDSSNAASTLGARAFTDGSDVHFGAGQFAPGTKEGDRLLAHELTHVVQGQRSGIQRKKGEDTGADSDGGGLEVSQPGDAAEVEADAVADHVADNEQVAEGSGAAAESAPRRNGNTGGESPVGEQARPIAAELAGVGRKIFRSPTPAVAAAPGSAPASAAAVTDAASLRAFCAPDPIAVQKLDDVDAETNMDPGEIGNGAAKTQFYQNMVSYVQANPNVNPATIFNANFNNAASSLKFKGKKIPPEKINQMCSRTCGIGGWYWTAVDKAPIADEVRRFLGDPTADQRLCEQLGYDQWKKTVQNGSSVLGTMKRGVSLTPRGPTWFTPDSYHLSPAADAGYGELLRLAALQPEWFPEGNVVFEIEPTGFLGASRKPTAYDGMQSSLWVSRPTGEDFGVTGGGTQEFLANDVSTAGVKSARAVVPSAEMSAELQAAIASAKENALQQDPQLRAASQNPATKAAADAMVPNLTDQFIRGDIHQSSIPTQIRNTLTDVTRTAGAERANPSAPREGTGRRV